MVEEKEVFGILEEKITELVESYSSIKREKIALNEKLKQKEIELQNLQEKIAILTKEREMAKEKIANLLSRLENVLSPGQGE